MLKFMGNNKKGSLTVEASIVFPIFLCFFLLLAFFIKAAYINIILDHAVNETAKQLATSCYPLSFLNELEDDLLQGGGSVTIPTYVEEKGRILGYIKDSTLSEDVLAKLVSGEMTAGDITEITNEILNNVTRDFQDGIKSYITDRYADKYFEVKTRAKYKIVKYLMNKFTEGTVIDDNNLNFILIELPQGVAEFKIKEGYEDYRELYEELGYVPDPDNVVVAIEYKMNAPIPFFSETSIVTRHMAVERAWLYGSNGIYTVSDIASGAKNNDETDGDEEEDSANGDNPERNKNRIVYVTKSGSKYHEAGCEYIKKHRAYRELTIDEAEREGKAPCKICILKTAEYVWKKRN